MTSVLFLYPNLESETRIPLAVSILISYARNMNCDVDLFDTTFMIGNNRKDDHLQEDLGILKKTNIDEMIGGIPEIDLDLAWEQKLREFKPDIIACSLLERNFVHADRFLKVAKNYAPKCRIVVGGILPTIAEDFVKQNMPYVDDICAGEGEDYFAQYVINAISPKSYKSVYDMDHILWQDWRLFDDRHLLKAFDGNVYKAGSFEFSRGCHRVCTFCVAPELKKFFGRKRKSVAAMINELEYFKDKYELNMISFCDVGFIETMSDDDKEEFAMKYSDRINLPYIIQAGAPALSKIENVRFLKKTGCVTVSIGVESGSKNVRYNTMKKHITNELIEKAFENMREFGIRTTANFMIGLPDETEEEIFETIEFCKKIRPESIAICYFVPFLGTKLYDYCINKGYYKFDPYADVYEGSPLNQKHITKERLTELYKIFSSEFSKISNQ